MPKKRSQLVIQHVEHMRRRILEKHQEVIREYVKGKRGVYALYRDSELYYVGLASNLRSRLRAHLRDRHAAAWDRFSLYLTEGDEHLRELEALVLRITKPEGNRSTTKFAKSHDLRGYFKRRIQERYKEDLEDLFNSHPRSGRARPRGEEENELVGLVERRTPLRMTYKGKVYRATLRPDGLLRFKGRLYNSPSGAVHAVIHRAANGWWCWKYEAAPGRWLRLTALRAESQRSQG